MEKRVAVIGAGASGLPAIKCCLDEGLVPVCYERSDHIGGLWCYTEKDYDGQGCVNKSTTINTGKEITSYSDFPMPKEADIFMHNTVVMKYLHLYADNFDLKKYIKFKHSIVSIKKAEDFAKTGKWEVQVTNNETTETTTEIFDAVLVCTGHHAQANVATFPGQEKFKGKVMHSKEYKHPEGYEDKRCVVVGIGNSGGDVAVELARVGQVFLSTRRGAWVLQRIGPNGVPFDIAQLTRFSSWLPIWWANYNLERHANQTCDHVAYSLKPKHRITGQHPTVNDMLSNTLANGSVKLKSNIKKFTETGVEFDDGTFEDDIYAVIIATGYKFGFPFIDKEVLDIKDNRNPMFLYMFPPELEKMTLACIGCYQPFGSVMPTAEMQSRLATRVFKGLVQLPSRGEMLESIKQKELALAKRYVQTQRHTMQIDLVPFMDEISELMDCKPNIGQLALRDPYLAWEVVFGPCTAYQYRLQGPGAWSGARDAIMHQWERSYYPLKARNMEPETKDFMYYLKIAIVVLIVAWLLGLL